MQDDGVDVIEPRDLGRGSYAQTMGRTFWQFVAVLLVVGFVGAYFWWIVAALAAWRWCTTAAGGG